MSQTFGLRDGTALGQEHGQRVEEAVGSPYGLQLVENCLICKLRTDNFFCALPREVLEAFERIKFPTAYPRGAV
ncbi:MAG TPA: hypothetical protein VK473_16815, partial [Terriglobales bacterium]|nr:hypothetical protein [Terriglobales bacterium]